MSFGKRVIVVVLMAAMVIGIMRVGNSKNIEIEEDQKNAYYKTETVYFWYNDEAFTDYFMNAAVEFHKINPEIRVIPVLVGATDYLEHINEATLRTEETAPDLYILSNDSLEKAYLSGLASPTKDVCNTLNSLHFSEAALNAVSYKNYYVAYPFGFETTVLLYNKTYLENWVEKVNSGEGSISDDDKYENEDGTIGDISEDDKKEFKQITLEDLIPKTFDDLIEFSGTYEAEEGVESILKWDVNDIFYNYLFAGNYLNIGGPSGGDSTSIEVYNEGALNSVKAYQNLNQVFSIDKASSDYETIIKNFADGKIVFTIATSDVIPKLIEATTAREALLAEVIEENKKLLEEASADSSEEGEEAEGEEKPQPKLKDEPVVYEFGYATIPDFSDKLATKSLSVTDALVVNGYSEVKESANRFASYLTTECAKDLYTRTGLISASLDAEYEEGNPCKVFQMEYGDSAPLAKLIEASDLWVQLEIAFSDIWAGEDAEARLKALDRKLKNQLLSE